MQSLLMRLVLCTGLAGVLLLALPLFPFAVAGFSMAQAAETVTVTSVDQEKRLVTVRNDRTGRTEQITVETLEGLQSFKVGAVLEKPAALEVQPRALQQGPPTMSGKTFAGSCFERCMAAPGSSSAQCAYWCATR